MTYKEQIAAYYPTCEQERVDKKVIYHYIEDYPHNILLRSNEIGHLTSSGFIMNKDLTRVLVIFHKVYQAWGWTGGHMDGDLDCLEVAVKEAKEETGLTHLTPLSQGMMSIDILPVWGHSKRDNYVSAHLHLNASYVLIADEKEPLIENVIETEGVMWIDVEDLGQYCNEPDLVVVYQKLIKAAKKYNPSKAISVTKQDITEDGGLFKVIKDTTIPIAVHEAKSAYYKAKLVKEVASRGGKGIINGVSYLFKKNKINRSD